MVELGSEPIFMTAGSHYRKTFCLKFYLNAVQDDI